MAELRCEDDLGSCLVIDGNSDEHGTRRQSLGALSRFGRGICPLETGHQYLVEHPLGAFFLGVLLQGALVKGGEDPDSAAGRDGSADHPLWLEGEGDFLEALGNGDGTWDLQGLGIHEPLPYQGLAGYKVSGGDFARQAVERAEGTGRDRAGRALLKGNRVGDLLDRSTSCNRLANDQDISGLQVGHGACVRICRVGEDEYRSDQGEDDGGNTAQ